MLKKIFLNEAAIKAMVVMNTIVIFVGGLFQEDHIITVFVFIFVFVSLSSSLL